MDILEWCIKKECKKKKIGRKEEIRKRGRPRRRCTDEVEEDLKIMGIIDRYSVVRDREERPGNALESKLHFLERIAEHW